MMNKKMNYIAPELELIEVAKNDVISTSSDLPFLGEDDALDIN